MNKKIVFLILIIVIVGLGVAGFFYWQNREIKGSPDDYVIIETSEGKFVENKRAGLRVKVLEGWKAEKIEFLEGSLGLYSQDIDEISPDGTINLPLQKGCAIGTGLIYKKMNFDEIKKEIKDIHAGLGIKSEEFEVISINSQEALKNTFDSVVEGSSISVYLPNKNKVYNFGVYWAPQDKERCIQEFDKFLEGVVIE